MKNRYQVWTKEPYGEWLPSNPKPITRQLATAQEKELQQTGRPIAIAVLPAGEKPTDRS